MDIATIIGLVGGSLVIIMAIVLGGSVLTFFDIPSILIVGGGTVSTIFIKFKMNDVINSINVTLKAFLVKMESPEKIIKDMVAYTRVAKKEGLIALEKEEASDVFVAKALRYLSDGYDEGLIKDMLQKDIQLTVQRHTIGQDVLKAAGDMAPAFGMIGTLVGLVQMLSDMDDPSKIGPAMAVALLTTLYGAVIANLICIPLADKLSLRSNQEMINKNIIMEAAVGINRGISPIVLEESLKIFLSPKERSKIEQGEET